MRRALIAVAAIIVAIVIAAVMLQRCRHRDAEAPAGPAVGATGSGGSATRAASSRPLPSASIAGAVHDERSAAIAGARVCADLEAGLAPACATTDARGAYAIQDLLPGRYQVAAAAPERRPAVYRPGGDRRNRTFRLAPGEHRAGVDLVLRAGGARLAGVVSDINGGPIAHAEIRAGTIDHNLELAGRWGAIVESDAAGAFVAWVDPGSRSVRVSADGYALLELSADAPGELDIRLTPSGSIAGTVVDEHDRPVEGADVSASAVDTHVHARSDAAGKFEIDGLAPDRYDVTATIASGIAHSAGSVMVSLGGQVSGLVLRMHRGARISGRIVLADGAACAEPLVELHETSGAERIELAEQPDGTLAADAIPAGRYALFARCPGYYPPARFPVLDITDRDIEGQVWKLSPGGTIRGHVITVGGDPVEDARVTCDSPSASREDFTAPDGTFACTGLPPGRYTLAASTAHAGEATATVELGATPAEQELIVDEGAIINGIVVDPTGRPVDRVEVQIAGKGGAATTTDGGGQFSASVRPGTHEVRAVRETFSDLGPAQTVTVAAGQSASVRLVIPAQTGKIRGTVIDAAGAPVADAWVNAELPKGMWAFFDWTWIEHAVVTRPDGTFVIDRLGPGPYTVKARRRGGGEIEQAGVDVGATIQLRLATTGSLAGTVAFADGRSPASVELTLRVKAPRFYRTETFIATSGAWTITDLPPGDYTIAAVAPGGFGTATATIGPGETRRGIAVALDATVAVAGRFIEAVSHAPIADIGVALRTDRAELGTSISWDDPQMHSDADGRFRLLGPPGGFSIDTMLPGGLDPDKPKVWCLPEIRGTAPVDLGDIEVARCGDKH